MLDVLDACKISDYVIFVVSTDSTLTDITEHKLRCVLGQGVSNTYVISEVTNNTGISDQCTDLARSPQIQTRNTDR